MPPILSYILMNYACGENFRPSLETFCAIIRRTFYGGCGKRPKKTFGKRPKPVCWKTTETFWVVGKRPKPSCWKTAEISAVFQQSPHRIVDSLFSAVFKQLVVVVRKRPKFLPFSNKITTKWLMVCFLPFSNNHSKL